MRRLAAGLAVFFLLMSLVPADGALLDFEIAEGVIPDGYGGLNWDNMSVFDTAGAGGAFEAGTVSGTRIAFNNDAFSVAKVDGSAFDFLGAYLTAAWDDDLVVDVTGFSGAVQVDTKSVKVDTIVGPGGPDWIQFNFWDIDQVTFNSHLPGGDLFKKIFIMDDFKYNTTPDSNKGGTIPEPSTLVIWSLLGLLGITVGWYRRRKAA